MKQLIASLCLLSTLALHASPDRTSTPNLVIIFCDDLGYADIGCFGAKGYKTPNLDRMAQEGIRFTRFYDAQPVCSASRAGLMTGCYPSRVGIQGALGPSAKIGISSNEMTFAEMVKQRGYTTAIFGKWHLGCQTQFLPTHHGFDEFFGLPYSHDMWPYHPETKVMYPPLPLIEGDQPVKVGLTHADITQLTTWYTEHAVKFIEKNKDRPFFLYVPHNLPHVPLAVSDKFKGKTKRGLFGDVIEEVDWSVGQILGAIKKNGLDKDTLVIFTSDNGPWLLYGNHAGSAYPLREGKATCWEGGFRVPFIARWPGKIPKGKVCKEPGMTIDLLPTFAKLIGAELPKHKIDGMNIWPLLSGDPKAKNPHESYWFWFADNQLQAVMSGKWKLQLPHTYHTLGGKPGGHDGKPGRYEQRKLVNAELYDLDNDISETTDLAAKYPEQVKRLEAFAEQAREELGDSLTHRVGKGAREPGHLAQ